MSEQVTIKKVYRDLKKTKFGEKMMTSIYVLEYPEVRMSSFDKGLDSWKEGDKVLVTVTKNGEFTNFSTKNTDSKTNLEARVLRLERQVFGEKPETAKVVDEVVNIEEDDTQDDW